MQLYIYLNKCTHISYFWVFRAISCDVSAVADCLDQVWSYCVKMDECHQPQCYWSYHYHSTTVYPPNRRWHLDDSVDDGGGNWKSHSCPMNHPKTRIPPWVHHHPLLACYVYYCNCPHCPPDRRYHFSKMVNPLCRHWV